MKKMIKYNNESNGYYDPENDESYFESKNGKWQNLKTTENPDIATLSVKEQSVELPEKQQEIIACPMCKEKNSTKIDTDIVPIHYFGGHVYPVVANVYVCKTCGYKWKQKR